jgi:hypothetical protein
MARPYNRSLSIALRRLRFAVFMACTLLIGSLGVQLVAWSLATFTDVRYAAADEDADGPVVVKGRDNSEKGSRRRERERKAEEEAPPEAGGTLDTIMGKAVDWSRNLGLMAGVVLLPLIGLGIILAVPAGAIRIELAVTALVWSIVLVALALPLGGWFGLAWSQGTLTDYAGVTAEVDAVRAAEGISFGFYLRFLLLPAASAVAFVIVNFKFGGALEGVLLRAGMEDVDPELEREASNVNPSSLHGSGRTEGALKRVLKEGKAKRLRKKGDEDAESAMPRRLI